MKAKARPAGAVIGGVENRAITGGHTTTVSPDLVCMRTGNTERHSRDCLHVHPIHTAGARAVHGKWGVRRRLARMMLALLAATRCLALSACSVLFVWCVCVIAVSVLSTAPLRRLRRLPRRWERTPCAATSVGACNWLRASEFTARARVLLACLCIRFCPVKGWKSATPQTVLAHQRRMLWSAPTHLDVASLVSQITTPYCPLTPLFTNLCCPVQLS